MTEIFTAFQETSRSNDQTDLIEAVTTRIKASPDHATVFLLRAAGGQVLAASLPDIWYQPGWSTIEAATLGIQTDYPYHIFAGKVNRHTIIVGLTDADLDDLAEISRRAFVWSALGVLLAVIGIGVWIATCIQVRITEVEAVLHRVAQGDLTARLTLSRAGSDLDQISYAINNALGLLVEAMRQVSADIAHDLRTPLNRLRIRIEAAAEAEAKGLPVTADLAAAIAESDAISQTFSALLRIAQIEAGTARQKFTVLDLCEVIQAVAKIYTEVAEDVGMTLLCHTSGSTLVEGDKELLTQPFANLIENALRHCPQYRCDLCG